MQVSLSAAPLASIEADALILPLPAGDQPLDAAAAALDQAANGAISAGRKSPTFKGKAEQVESLFPVLGATASRVVLVGIGDEPLDAEGWRRVVSAGIGAVRGKVRRVAIALPAGLEASVAASAGAEAAVLSAYTFHPYQKPDPDDITLDAVVIAAPAAETLAEAARRGEAIARNVCWVRDLSNTPGNMLTPAQLVDEATKAAKAVKLECQVFDFEQLQKNGFGGVVAVGKASEHKPAFVVLEYRGGKPEDKPIVLVGKGVTFDTGGICIKPRAGMEEMKTDMHGAATVMGTLKTAAERKLPINLVGLLPIAENMPDGNANLPGDVYTAYNGMTVEVLDTDAEGRLILADGLGYAVKHYEPVAVIDLATLTGSIITALGYEATGLFTNRDALAKELIAAGQRVGERCWQFPTWDSYQEQVKSDIADVRNLGKGKGDAIHAAMFLKSFVGDVPWVHLDIAGSSFIPDEKPYRPKGSTGVGVRLLIDWLETRLA